MLMIIFEVRRPRRPPLPRRRRPPPGPSSFSHHPSCHERQDFPVVTLSWFTTIACALSYSWAIQDPVVIFVRNNLSCTKRIVRTQRYQTLEKFFTGPLRIVAEFLA